MTGVRPVSERGDTRDAVCAHQRTHAPALFVNVRRYARVWNSTGGFSVYGWAQYSLCRQVQQARTCMPPNAFIISAICRSINRAHGIASAFSPRHRGIAYHLSHSHGSLARGYASATAWVHSAGRHRLGRTTEAHSETAARCAASCRGTVSHRSHSMRCGACADQRAVVPGFCMAQKQQRRQCTCCCMSRCASSSCCCIESVSTDPCPCRTQHRVRFIHDSRVLPSNLSARQTGRRRRRAGAQAYQRDHMRKHATPVRVHTRA